MPFKVAGSSLGCSDLDSARNSRVVLGGRQVGDGMGGGWNGRFWGAPILAKTLENTAFFHKKMQNPFQPPPILSPT